MGGMEIKFNSFRQNLKQDLIKTAYRSRRMKEYKKWKTLFKDVKEDPLWRNRNVGELVLIYQQGWGPVKRPRIGAPRFPELFPISSSTKQAKLVITQDGKPVSEELSQQVFSVEDVAIKTLNDDYGRLVAKRVGGVVAKAVVSDQIRQKNQK